jgi:tRNA(Ile)-lysidine synthase
MLENLATVLSDHCLLDKSRLVVVGVSGGPDSLCLLSLLRAAGYPLIAAHFDHQLRPESSQEGEIVRQVASSLKVPFVSEAGDVQRQAKECSLTVEEAARHMRYDFLFRQARSHEAQAVAVGHTADDQVETVLMHFLRGAGLTGLKGMTYRSLLAAFDAEIPLVRPLLDVWRADTVRFCAANDLQPVMDSSNESIDYTRNRLRKLLIPTLETYNPRFREAVWRSVQSLQDDHALLLEMVDGAWPECVIQESSGLVVFGVPQLMRFSPALQRYLLRRAVERLQPGIEITFAVLSRGLDFIHDSSARQVDLVAGMTLLREDESLYLSTSPASLPVDQWPQLPAGGEAIPVEVPGLLELPHGWRLESESWRFPGLARQQAEHNQDPFQAWLDGEKVTGPLELRTRRPGDRFEPLGMDGHAQKLSDFMVNEKIPRRLRDCWPLLCSGEMILWVPGCRPAHPCRLTSLSRRVLYFSLAQLSG